MSQPTRWLQVTDRNAFEPGKLARITETYAAVTVVYEGTVKSVNHRTVALGDGDNSVAAWLPGFGGESVRVEAYVAPQPLPTKRGTIIEFYDVAMLDMRTATLGADEHWWVNGKPDFELADTGFTGEFRVIYEPTE